MIGESMDSEDEAPRRTSRARKRTHKGEEYEESMQGSSPLSLSLVAAASHHLPADFATQMSVPIRHDENPSVLAGAGTKRAAVPPPDNPAKKARKPYTSRKIKEKPSLPAALTAPKHTPSQNAGRAVVVDRYQLPSFDNMEIRSALVFDDGADNDWRDFDGNADHWYHGLTGLSGKSALARGKNISLLVIVRSLELLCRVARSSRLR